MPREELFTYQPLPDERAHSHSLIEVDTARRASFRVPRTLFGNFLEHIDHSIYHGLWAQILDNPGFEWHHPSLDVYQRALRDDPPADAAVGLPWPWERRGGGQVAHCRTGRLSQYCLRIRLRPGERGGLAQRAVLPIQRQRVYTGSFWAREVSLEGGVWVSLSSGHPLDTGAPPLASAEVTLDGSDWRRYTFRLEVPAGSLEPGDPVEFAIGARYDKAGGSANRFIATVWLDDVSLFPDDHVDGMDPDAVRIFRDWGVSVLRYPGGCFADGYHWADGVGPRDDRPARPNPHWPGLEYNFFGTDEFMAFCRLAGCEPLLTVNVGSGTPEEAAAWVEYCNGAAATRFGAWRAKNGHPEPYGVKYWEIGNELYGYWEIGHMDPVAYAEKYMAFRQAMRAVDPSITLLACGHDSLVGGWNDALLAHAAPGLELVAWHFLPHNTLRLAGGREPSPEEVYRTLLAYPDECAALVEAFGQAMARHPRVPVGAGLAVTEWTILGQRDGVIGNANLGGAVYAAAFMNMMIRRADVVRLAAHTGAFFLGGCVKEQEQVYARPQYWVLQAYAAMQGAQPVACRAAGPSFAVPERPGEKAVGRAPSLDPIALLNDDEDCLNLAVVNRDLDRDVTAAVRLLGFRPAEVGTVAQLASNSPLDTNTPEAPDRVRLKQQAFRVNGTSFLFTFPRHSVTWLTLRRE